MSAVVMQTSAKIISIAAHNISIVAHNNDFKLKLSQNMNTK